MSLPRGLGATYGRIGRTYRSRAPSTLLLALVVFIPLGLLDTLAAQADLDSLDLSSGIKVAALLLAVTAITTTGLLGEVFFSGAVAVSLTHPRHAERPRLLEIARHLRYGRLIAVDLLYVAIVVVGLVLFVVPGVLAFVWFGLAGAVVELEECGARRSLGRSLRLVRGNFWLVFWVLFPIEVGGDLLGEALDSLVHHLLGESFFAVWLAESVSNVVLSPLFAIAAVLLTIELIWQREGSGPQLNSPPRST